MKRGFREIREIKEDREIRSNNNACTQIKPTTNTTIEEALNFWNKVFESEESVKEFIDNMSK